MVFFHIIRINRTEHKFLVKQKTATRLFTRSGIFPDVGLPNPFPRPHLKGRVFLRGGICHWANSNVIKVEIWEYMRTRELKKTHTFHVIYGWPGLLFTNSWREVLVRWNWYILSHLRFLLYICVGRCKRWMLHVHDSVWGVCYYTYKIRLMYKKKTNVRMSLMLIVLRAHSLWWALTNERDPSQMSHHWLPLSLFTASPVGSYQEYRPTLQQTLVTFCQM